MEIKRTNVKKELPELSEQNLSKNFELDFKTIDTNLILNYAGNTAKHLRTAKLDSKIKPKNFEILK